MTIVYLAGGISWGTYRQITEWRNTVTAYFAQHNIATLDPMRGNSEADWEDGGSNFSSPNRTAADIFFSDISDILEADALLVNLLPAPKSTGTHFEMGFAWANDKPLYIASPPELQGHPFIAIPAKGIYNSLTSACKTIVEHYGIQSCK